jgi:hypothetical protein
VFRGPYDVAVDEVEDPKVQDPRDVVVKVTTTCICGSDLHMYEGRTDAESGLVFGHENLGIIEEVGSGVTSLRRGQRVVMPFDVARGFCRNCRAGKTAFCETVNPGFAGGAYGHVSMGPYTGGQAEYLRVPFADFNCVPLPDGEEHETDFALLADIFPTGSAGPERADLDHAEPGHRVRRGDLERLVAGVALDQVVAGHLLLRLGERPVGDHPAAVPQPHRGSLAHRRQPAAGQPHAAPGGLRHPGVGVGPDLLVADEAVLAADHQQVLHGVPPGGLR